MVGLRVFAVLVCVAGLGQAQLQFPGESENPATTSQPQNSPASPPGSTPNNLNTRFLPGLEGLDFLGLFTDPCQRCSFNDQQLANQCCQSGKRNCCAFLQPIGPVGPQFGGQFPGQFGGGQFPGQFGGGQFPGQFGGQFPGQLQGQFPGVVGPPGIPGQLGGGKPGVCPFLANTETGFNRFAGASCVQECQSDFHCSGIQKCCPVGCSSVCRSPPGSEGGFSQPATIKPGFCPRPKGLFGGLFGTRSGATPVPGSTRFGADVTQADTLEGDAAAGSLDKNEARELRKEQRKQQRREDRIAARQEGQRKRRSPQDNSGRSPSRDAQDDRREVRSPQRESQDDQRERRLNRFQRVFNRNTRDASEDEESRVRRSPQQAARDDFRERRRNRFERVFGRVTRDASQDLSRVRRSPQRDSQDDRLERRRNRFERVFGRVTREAAEHEVEHTRPVRQATDDKPQQDTRFFLPTLPKVPNIFCRDECFNDFDCPGNLKCCVEDDCRKCVNPSFF